jgi:hypothetical protein
VDVSVTLLINNRSSHPCSLNRAGDGVTNRLDFLAEML